MNSTELRAAIDMTGRSMNVYRQRSEASYTGGMSWRDKEHAVMMLNQISSQIDKLNEELRVELKKEEGERLAREAEMARLVALEAQTREMAALNPIQNLSLESDHLTEAPFDNPCIIESDTIQSLSLDDAPQQEAGNDEQELSVLGVEL